MTRGSARPNERASARGVGVYPLRGGTDNLINEKGRGVWEGLRC